MVQTLGDIRREYLDMANKLFVNGQVGQADEMVKRFLTTIKDNTPLAAQIKKEFDKILDRKEATWNDAYLKTEKMESWKQGEERSNIMVNLAHREIDEKINICWQICLEHGLFEA